MFGFIVVRLKSVVVATAPLRMFGKTGAPVCVGDRLMLVCRRLARSDVFPAESSALASARSGTRSKKRPALPRTIVRRESSGDHAKPARGETLFLSVLMVSRNCRSYRRPAFRVSRDVAFHSSCAYMPKFGLVCVTTDGPNVWVKPALL